MVVLQPPPLGEHGGLRHRVEDIPVEELIAEAAVEGLDAGYG